MPRLTSTQAALLSVLAVLAGCARQPSPPAKTPTAAAYVPPPLPTPPSAPWCTRPGEQTAFDEAALKSNLMVIAVTCHKEDQYNAFMRRFLPALRESENTIDNYFRRNDRRSWQKQRDDYITQLANAQSQRALVLGDQFCARNEDAFDAVLQLPSAADLGSFAAGKATSIPQAMAFSACATPGTAEQHAAKSGEKRPVRKKPAAKN
jgi:hypothetical protein